MSAFRTTNQTHTATHCPLRSTPTTAALLTRSSARLPSASSPRARHSPLLRHTQLAAVPQPVSVHPPLSSRSSHGNARSHTLRLLLPSTRDHALRRTMTTAQPAACNDSRRQHVHRTSLSLARHCASETAPSRLPPFRRSAHSATQSVERLLRRACMHRDSCHNCQALCCSADSSLSTFTALDSRPEAACLSTAAAHCPHPSPRHSADVKRALRLLPAAVLCRAVLSGSGG